MKENIWDSEIVRSFTFHPRRVLPEGNTLQGFTDGNLVVEPGVTIAYRIYKNIKKERAPLSPRRTLGGGEPDPASSRRTLGGGEPYAAESGVESDSIESLMTPRGRTSSVPSTPRQQSNTEESKAGSENRGCIIFYFHGNGELCTGLHSTIQWFYRAGAHAVFCAEFRGYAWSTGEPSLDKLNPDAEAFADVLSQILRGQGLDGLPVILFGRSLGATCAVHLAAKFPHCYAGLILDSALTDISRAPLINDAGWMMPGIQQELERTPDPLQTLPKLRKVIIPTLMLHAEDDTIVPSSQAKIAIRACGADEKLLKRFENCGHNTLKTMHMTEYFKYVKYLCQHAIGGQKWHRLTNGQFDDGPAPKKHDDCPVL